ncbi:MAG: isoamylase early set domain-containing protein [Longimicrobiales bacterium]
MHPDVHRYLDGEIDRSALSAEALVELQEWESLDRMVAQRRAERAPAFMVNDIMRALPPVRQSPLQTVISWLVTPRPIRIAPFAPLALAAAAVTLVVLIPSLQSHETSISNAPAGVTTVAQTSSGSVSNAPASTVYVQFALIAKGAQSVAVAGDFNSWSEDSGMLRDADGDGTWVGMVPVQPGVHKYMFIVDGKEWVTDPRAEGYADDGFGMKNAILSVRPPAERTI